MGLEESENGLSRSLTPSLTLALIPVADAAPGGLMRDVGYWMLDIGYWMLDGGWWKVDAALSAGVATICARRRMT
jgi:hypothetical protein